MIVVGGTRRNYGNMYPDIDYPGTALGRGPFGGLPGPLGPTNGFGALSTGNIIEYGVLAVAAWFAYKKFLKPKLGL